MTVASSTVYQIPGIPPSIDLYASAYGESGLTAQEVLEEIICDAEGQMNAFATEETKRVAGEVGLFLRNVRKAAKDTGATKNTTGEGGVKHSRETFMEEAKAFSQEINLWEKEGKQSGQSFIIGSTGEVLQGLGAIESDIYINGDKIKTILMEHQEITLDEIKKIPQILNDPTLILKSRNVGRSGAQNTRMAVYGSVKGKNGMPMMVVFDIRPMENHLVINDMQKVVSAYTKTNDGVSFVKNSFVMYAGKKRATSLLRSIGFQMPIELLQSGYIGSIAYKKRSVNLYGAKFSDVFRQNSTENKYSREMQSMEELRRVNRALERKLETVQRQAAREIQNAKEAHGITKTPTANRDDVAAVARRLLRDYGSKSKQWFIREELQKIADAIIGDQNADFSALRDQAKGIADNILQGASYDINWELADIKKEFKDSPMHKNGCRQESY